MHRHHHRGRPLIPFDPEIEATARRQSGARKRQLQQDSTMAERNPRVLWDYILPQATGLTSSIVNPGFEANNFKLRPALVSFVEKDQFSGVLRRTLILTFTTSWRSVKRSSSTGSPLTLSDFGSSPSRWRTEPVTGSLMKSLIPSPPGRPYRLHFSASAFPRVRSLSWERKSPPSLNEAMSHFMRHGKGSRIYNANAPTTEYPTGF